MLSQLVYVSSAVIPFSPVELTELLQTSRRNNAAAGITGLLLYVGGNFMQALEGDERAVDALYRTIATDPRHRSVTKIISTPTERRLFAEWAMGFKETDCLPPEQREEISSFLDDVARQGSASAHIGRPVPFLLENFALTMR